MKKTFFCLAFLLIAISTICLGASINKTQADSVYTDGYRVNIFEMINTHLGGDTNLRSGSKISSQPGSNNDVILFRVVRNCADSRFHYGKETSFSPISTESGYVRYGQLNVYDLEDFRQGTYRNYTCGDRYQDQCINDGSFDTYYEELCMDANTDISYDYESYDYENIEADVEYENTGNNDRLILYRAVLDCSTGEPIGERSSGLIKKTNGKYQLDYIQIFDLENYVAGKYYNYTCNNRYQQQCVNDGTYDSYYNEVCLRIEGNEDISLVLNDIVSELNIEKQIIQTSTVTTTNNFHTSGNDGIKDLIRSKVSNYSDYLNNPISYRPSSNDNMTLFRVVRSCSTGEEYGTSYSKKTKWKPGQWMIGRLQMLDLEEAEGGYYQNYTCSNRYQEQCINDSSFDIYYEEFCSHRAN